MKRLGALAILAAAVFSAVAPHEALAYGDQGHRTVGAIADRLIAGSNAAKQVQALLLPGENLEQATIWMDCVKGSYCGPQSDEMKAYVEANPKHDEYHYTNTPIMQPAYQPGGPGARDDDIVQMLRQAIAVLQGRDDAASNPHKLSKRQALLLLAHLAGDIHQPLHVGTAYMDKENRFVLPRSKAEVDNVNIFDLRGDNNLIFADAAYDRPAWPNQPAKPQNMHFFWDITAVETAFRQAGVKGPGEFADKAILSKAATEVTLGEAQDWPLQWMQNSLVAARAAHLGVSVVEKKSNTDRKGAIYYTWTFAVPANYGDIAAEVTAQQMVRGGYNFAALLQKIWP